MGIFICVHEGGIVDTSNEIVSVRVAGAKKRRRSVEERRRIVEATLQPGASVSRVARPQYTSLLHPGGSGHDPDCVKHFQVRLPDP